MKCRKCGIDCNPYVPPIMCRRCKGSERTRITPVHRSISETEHRMHLPRQVQDEIERRVQAYQKRATAEVDLFNPPV